MRTQSAALAFSFFCISIASAPLLSQINSQNPLIRIGDLARQLTEDEVAVVELALPQGQMPWLLIADPPQLASEQHAQVFLPPSVSTPDLRRGSRVGLKRERIPPNANGGFGLWNVEFTADYAQVSIPGRSFDQIDGDQDINRPFAIIGRFSDADLIGMVRYLRSNPPTPTTGGPSESIKLWPILSVARKAGDSVQVMLRGAAGSGQVVTLRQEAQGWVILRVGMWIA